MTDELLNPQEQDRSTPTIYGSGVSKTQQYWDARQENLPTIEDTKPGILDQYMPSTNRRGSPDPMYQQPPAEEAPPPEAGQDVPPMPGEDEGQDLVEPPVGGGPPGADDGRDGNRGAPPGGGGKPRGRYSIHQDRSARGRNYVARWVAQELPDGNDAAFLMANGKLMDGAAKVVQRIPGRTYASKALAARRLKKTLKPQMNDYIRMNKEEEDHKRRLFELEQEGDMLTRIRNVYKKMKART